MVFTSLEEFSTVSCDLHFQSFGMDNKVEVDIFLELSCFFDNPTYVGYLISDSSAFSKFSLNIWKLTVHTLLKPGLEKVHILFSMFLNFLNMLFNIMIYSTKICMTVGINKKIYIYMVVYYCLWDSLILTSILSFRTAALEYIGILYKISLGDCFL